MKVAVIKEAAPWERRVALVPEGVAKLRGAGLEVLAEAGAGTRSWLADEAYAEAGATVLAKDELLAAADVLLMVGPPDARVTAALRAGQLVLGLLAPLTSPDLVATAGQGGSDRDQPRPAAAHAAPGPADGRAVARRRASPVTRPPCSRRRDVTAGSSRC